jgi:glyoxylase-like metal-dependent hydrolase (beta-lactamase superfamily II)
MSATVAPSAARCQSGTPVAAPLTSAIPSRERRTPFMDVADRVWVARQDWFGLNVCLVGGSTGLVVVDSQGSARAAKAIVVEVRALGSGDVTAVVNTP